MARFMKKISIVTKNPYLAQKIRLAFADFTDIVICDNREPFDICFWDMDTSGKAPEGSGIVRMSRDTECDLPIPFGYSSLFSCIFGGAEKLLLDSNTRSCILRGERIKLTELEYRLLDMLVSAGGEFVSRERILESVWEGTADKGIINVYIYYLREKLERGEKIILSSRGEGYCIDRRFLGDVTDA